MDIEFTYVAHICRPDGAIDVQVLVTNCDHVPLSLARLAAELYVSDYTDGPWTWAATLDISPTATGLDGLAAGESRIISLTFTPGKKMDKPPYVMVNFRY